jgi:hypothetical protein
MSAFQLSYSEKERLMQGIESVIYVISKVSRWIVGLLFFAVAGVLWLKVII